MLDVTFFSALIAGLLSFLSPCILPIVPFYLSYMIGAGINQASGRAGISGAMRPRAVLTAGLFALGIITVFVGLGATATAFSSLLRDYFGLLRWGAAAIIIVTGLHFTGAVRMSPLYRQFRASATQQLALCLLGAFVVGLAFAFGWTPCVGPVLSTILFIAAGQDTAAHGAALLFTYGLGMTLPFVAVAIFIGPFICWLGRFCRHPGLIEKLMGLLLILFGILIATNSTALIAQWMLEHMPWLNALG